MIHFRSVYLALKFLGGRNKIFRNKNLLGSVLGIGVAFIPMIVVLVVSGGMIEGITRRYMEIGSYHLQIKSYTDSGSERFEETEEILKNIPWVKAVFPVTTGVGLAYSENGRTGVGFRSLPSDFRNIDPDAFKYLEIKEGEFNLEKRDSAMLSTEVARILKASVGDRIKVLTARQIPGRKPVLKPSYFTVTGVFSTGYYELDSLSIYINSDKGRSLFSQRGDTFLAVKIEEPGENIESKTAAIQKDIPSNYQAFNWYQLEKPMLDSFNTTKTILLFIMIVIILVAAMNISSSVVMLVMEKQSEIAILKSTGVRPGVISGAFIFIGFFIGILGAFAGLFFGLAAAVNINELLQIAEIILNSLYNLFKIVVSPVHNFSDKGIVLVNSAYYLEKIPVKLKLFEVTLISSLTVLLSTAAAYLPSRRAGKLKPLDVIRKNS